MICGAARARLCLGNALEHTSLGAVPPASFEFIPFLKAASMPLITLDKASLSYGLQVLLDNVDLNIERGQRVCLIGRNGTGKSTLLKVLAGEVDLDSGSISRDPGIRLARLEQDLPEADDRRVFDVVADGVEGMGALLIARSEEHKSELQSRGRLV